jgi:dihydroflavonol-4-reductase
MPFALVTGANGFIGSRLVHALIERGQRVKGFVRAESDLRQLRDLPEDRFLLAVGDVRIEHTVYRALAGCDRMYHVAANYKLWDKHPQRILEPAIEGTHATLEAARKRGVSKIVFTSSVGALGVSRVAEPMDEEHEFNLVDPDPYVRAKYESEMLALEMADKGLPVVSVLPSAVVGPGDWKPTPTGAVILRYLKTAPHLRIPVCEGGANYADVDDVVNGHILAMEKGQIGQRYILGGENLTHEQLIETLSDITDLALPGRKIGTGLIQLVGRLLELRARLGGLDPIVTYRAARDQLGAYLWVTSERAESELGYEHRPAREALARAVRFYLEKGYVPESSARRVRLELSAT